MFGEAFWWLRNQIVDARSDKAAVVVPEKPRALPNLGTALLQPGLLAKKVEAEVIVPAPEVVVVEPDAPQAPAAREESEEEWSARMRREAGLRD